MSISTFVSRLKKNNIKFLTDEPLKKHTSFKIGGCADVFVMPKNYDELRFCLGAADQTETPVFILGNGSNILVSDKGIRGAVISTEGLSALTVDGEKVIAFAGAKLMSLCNFAKENSLSGLEFAYGIPGSVGGAVYMNAGAYGGEMKDVIESVYADKNGELVLIKAEELDFSYRHSCFCDSNDIIVYAVFSLKKGEKSLIDAKMKDIMQRRVDKQPLNYPSAGSVFKRPEGYFAGALIEGAGLKGMRIGGAEVSEKHAGFLINAGNATSKDVLDLIKYVQETVYKKDGVLLEPEVKLVGEF